MYKYVSCAGAVVGSDNNNSTHLCAVTIAGFVMTRSIFEHDINMPLFSPIPC